MFLRTNVQVNNCPPGTILRLSREYRRQLRGTDKFRQFITVLDGYAKHAALAVAELDGEPQMLMDGVRDILSVVLTDYKQVVSCDLTILP